MLADDSYQMEQALKIAVFIKSRKEQTTWLCSLSPALNQVICSLRKKSLIRSTTVSCKTILIRKDTHSGFSLEYRILAKASVLNSTFWTTQKPTLCSTTEWRSPYTVNKRQIMKKLGGTKEAPIFHILRTHTVRIIITQSFSTQPHSLTLLSMMMIQFTSATRILTHYLTWETTLHYTKKIKQGASIFLNKLFAKHCLVLIVPSSRLHPKEVSKQTINKKRKNVLLLLQESIQERQLAHGWCEALSIS